MFAKGKKRLTEPTTAVLGMKTSILVAKASEVAYFLAGAG